MEASQINTLQTMCLLRYATGKGYCSRVEYRNRKIAIKNKVEDIKIKLGSTTIF